MEGVNLQPYFSISIDPLFSVMSALVLAFVLGLGTSRLESMALRNCINDFRDIITMVIKRVIIPLLPIYIFGIFMSMTMAGQVGSILTTFIKIIAVIFALHVGVLLIQYFIASLFSHRNPFKCLWTMMPAYFTALGTQSSAATIPVTLSRTIEMGVNRDIAGFVIPLCATIHMSGSMLKMVACALALMISQGMTYDFGMFAGFIAMLAITIIAAPGVPGGAIMASLGLLSSMLGFSEADNAMMIALYIAMDSFGTACNITGDGAIAQIINRIFRADTAPAQPH
jgi:Na+/H+-dicarboxylate symporter